MSAEIGWWYHSSGAGKHLIRLSVKLSQTHPSEIEKAREEALLKTEDIRRNLDQKINRQGFRLLPTDSMKITWTLVFREKLHPL